MSRLLQLILRGRVSSGSAGQRYLTDEFGVILTDAAGIYLLDA